MTQILIADDDRNLAALYQQELSDEPGYEVSVVHDAREAIQQVEKDPPDLLVLDIRMPGMDGIEALNHILGRNNQLPVILNTAYSNYKDNFMTWAADAYVVKSSDLTELKKTIADVLARRAAEE